MKRRKFLTALLSVLVVGTAGIVVTPYITSQISSEAYSAMELTESAEKDISMNPKDEISVKLPEDFKLEDAVFGNTVSEVASYTSIENREFKITALKSGSTEITLTDGNYNYTLFVTVAQVYDSEIKISSSSMSATITNEGDTPSLSRTVSNYDSLKNLTVQSTSDSIARATIDDKGVITIKPQAEGKVGIKVMADGCPTVEIPVTVYMDIVTEKEIKLSDDGPIKIYMDDSKQKTIQINNYNKLKGAVDYRVSDSGIIRVEMTNNAFTIYARNEGETTITLSCDGADDKKVRVRVYDGTKSNYSSNDDSDSSTTTKITRISYEDSKITLEKGKTKTPSLTLKPSNVSDKYLRFESDDTSVATVSDYGKIKGIKKGTATITAYYSKDDDIYDTIKVTVTDSDKDDEDEDNSSSKKSSSSSSSSSSSGAKAVSKIPYALPVGNYNIAKILDMDEDRFKNTNLEIVNGVNNTNVVIDGDIYNIQVMGYSLTSGSMAFKDVKATHWSYLSVVKTVSKGLVAPKDYETFSPSDKLTYADTFSALSKLLISKNSYHLVSNRTVVDSYMENYDRENPNYLPMKNVMSKLPETEVKRYTEPGEIIYQSGISRIHMANILWTLTKDLGFTPTGNNYAFRDVQSTEMLNYVSDMGLMMGDTKGNFNPNQMLTRAELACIIDRLDTKLA